MSDSDWLEKEFKNIEFGDKRLRDRFFSMANNFSRRPDETINKAVVKFADKKATYRLFSHKNFSSDKILVEHRDSTASRLKNESVALMIHDSSFFSFNSKRSIKGLGNIGGKAGDQETHGFIGHYSLAVNTNDVPLGVMALSTWSRAYDDMWEKESDRWAEAILETEMHCPAGTKLIHIADREADQFEVLFTLIKNDKDFIIRSKHDRIIENGDHYLRWHLNKKKTDHECKIFHTKLKKDVDAIVKYGEIEFFDPSFKLNGLTSVKRKVVLNILEVSTTSETSEKDRLHWILLTSLPLKNFGDASRVIDYYKKRWHVENYFKILKDGGCKVERASLRTFERLDKYITLFSVIAWRIYYVKHLAEAVPDEDSSLTFSEEESLVLKIENKLPDDQKITIREALRFVAKMGGFNGRKSDGEPGTVSIWRGLIKLEAKVEMFKYLKEKYLF
jgi:Transposase Tn5 dimerisation domain/Transposase DNA-binding